MIIGAVVFLIGSIVLLKTVVGLRIYAIGGSREATELAGMRVDRYVTGLYTVNGGLLGLVALLAVAQVGSASPQVGGGFELQVLTAVILGGVAFVAGSTGHPFGVFVGVVTIGVLNAGVIFAGVASYWQQVVQGGALLLALGADQFSSYRRRSAARDRRGLPAAQRWRHRYDLPMKRPPLPQQPTASWATSFCRAAISRSSTARSAQ